MKELKDIDNKQLRAWLKKTQKPVPAIELAYLRPDTAEAISGINRRIIQEHISLYERTGGKEGLRSYKLRGREGRKGTRLIDHADFREYLPTILVDAAQIERRAS